jgi:hypothetical protein
MLVRRIRLDASELDDSRTRVACGGAASPPLMNAVIPRSLLKAAAAVINSGALVTATSLLIPRSPS